MNKSLLLGLSLGAVLAATNAQAVEFGKPISATVATNQSIKGVATQQKQVYLMNIKLTPEQKQKFFHYNRNSMQALASDDTSLPKKFDQGMNGVPVLDQGRHGSCVTFANTAAVDAVLGKGDYVSQLCNLELGSYLEKRSYLPSGWDGSLGGLVLNQMLSFGIVSQETQKSKTCAGVSEYPLNNEANTGNEISVDDYHQLSEPLAEKLYWEPALTMQDRMQWSNTSTESSANKVLQQVKQTLSTKTATGMTRVTFAVIIPVAYCSVGACGKYHANNDTWALTDKIKNDPNPEVGGHEMVITGYDDAAIAIDNEGKKHKGLLTLRNSWGTDAGDQGNYYMTYEFFKQFVMEVQKIGVEPLDQN